MDNTCPECGGPVKVWADNSGGVTVNFRCDNARCGSGKGSLGYSGAGINPANKP